jgi:hypothetical protein
MEQDIAIKRIVSKWTKSVLRMKWKNKEEAWAIMDSTKYGPSFWTTLPGRVDPDLCILILEEIKGNLHGKQRQILRSHISEAVRFRENMIQRGKQGQYIKSILRENTDRSVFEQLVDPEGNLITDPKEIQSKFTSYFKEAYATPDRHKNGIHQPDWEWQTGGTKEDFLGRVSHHGIPTHILEIIWKAMTTVPKAAAVQQDLSGIFEVPPTFEDFCKAISSRSGKSAGGISDLTYSMMKTWSLPFKTLVYNNLAALWGAPVPYWWKWRWLCPIPKTLGSNTPEGHRPVMLVEVLRKCWIGLIVFRITQV